MRFSGNTTIEIAGVEVLLHWVGHYEKGTRLDPPSESLEEIDPYWVKADGSEVPFTDAQIERHSHKLWEEAEFAFKTREPEDCHPARRF